MATAGRGQAARAQTGADELAEVVHDWWSETVPAPAARHVLRAAIELFAERGYHATTTRDIVTRIGMSTGAMYAYYRSKEDLLFEVCLAGHHRGVAALRNAIASTEAPSTQLPAMVRAFTVYHARYPTINKIVHYELYSMSEEHLAEVVELRKRTAQLMEDVIQRGVGAGSFVVSDVPGTRRALLSLCVDVARWYHADRRSSPDELGDLYAELSLRMVGAN